MIYISSISKFLDGISDKLTSFTNEYLSSPFMSAVIAIVLFVFACWAIKFFSKK